MNEAGASVYSASKLAGEEFPQLDVSQRSAISIARRLQDPLAELVKIDPKSIGVGLYQHDVNQKQLGLKLEAVVESVVNHVGVDLNTASAELLQYVAGIKSGVAKKIVAYREKNRRFISRKQLLAVPGLGEQTYMQAAGFLRISGGENFLDETAIHPERYDATKVLFDLFQVPFDRSGIETVVQQLYAATTERLSELREQLQLGLPTLLDMRDSLAKPGRDPREDLPPVVFSTDVLHFEDLAEGMVLQGIVRNVVDFGCFVDIGVHQDGLVHVSEISPQRITHPANAVKVGQQVKVKVISIDRVRKRIGLSIKQAR
ncbi:Protein YhgF [bioreactor metagenome]|uniref:Protein YhgF n=1 Tax=bioreactor metagenome TaxID=1076179 RepID=A0A645ARG0_9ZZZZ